MKVAERRHPAGYRLLCVLVSLLLLVRSSQQEEIYFVTQPQPYYYSYLNHLTHITCDAIHISDTGEETPIDATPIRNGERLVVDSLPARHELVKKGGVVRGVLVRETQREDQEGVYWCQVEGGGEVVAFTRKTHILVGDGRPLPVKGVDQLDQRLYSVALEWEEAPVPNDSPLQSYEITVLPQDRGSGVFEVEVDLNRTSVELGPLEPGSTYLVAVAGVNSNGVGNLSEYQTVMTLSPEVPRPPTHVTVEAVIGTTSTSMIVSWTPSPIDPEVMTPLTSYIIYYGRKTEDLDLLLSEAVQVSDGRREEVSEYTVTGVIMGGEVKVGVAAVNSAGASHVAYYQHTVGVGCSVLSTPEHGTVSQSGLSENSVSNYSCEQGFTLTGSKMRQCAEQGLWTGGEPTCTEDAEGIAFLYIIIISVAVVLALVVVISVLCVLIVVIRRKYVRMGREGHTIATFKNASPPLKRQKQHRNSGEGENGFEMAAGQQMGLAVLARYTEEPRVAGTPPPPDTTTFQTATPTNLPPSQITTPTNLPPSQMATPTYLPPSQTATPTNLPPSYSDLEEKLGTCRRNSGVRPDTSSNCSPPTEHSLEQPTKIPLSVSYSTEPRTAGSTPSPHPPIGTKQDSSGASDRSDANSTTRILD